ncbi:MAG: hypothetical protein GWN01_00155, partial [Nitrosopumilaceae archaeon]|nr:hypothetical protein [Nitrosopumilaceae archaeon]NIU85761.1 hypothetical protein [Nitrosopumilaceae archaeon]NIV64601.1 hypothetical protein [Nitrosopumilaceae archaeon]NIX60002.1 hypothetical protein [Nitrosopumilaceae archaeon]
LVTHVDDLQEEIVFLKEENESLRFDLQDKKFEEGPRRRTRRERGFEWITRDSNPLTR